MALHRFVQLSYAGLLGLPDGRYLARAGDQERVLIVETAAVPRAGRRSRRTRRAEPGKAETVPVTRLTVTAGEAAGEEDAARWVESVSGNPAARAAEVRAATRVINRALAALRAGAGDPLVQDVGATRALAIRIGFGSGEELAAGRWGDARELPPPRRGRLDEVGDHSRVAAVLAGREEVHPAETLLLRARLDLEMGRGREARYGARAARAALEAEPPAADAERIAEALSDLERRL